MNRTKIDWADFTWNVVTGCLHGCPYCYAKRIAEGPYKKAWPNGFNPTFYPERLGEPAKTKKPSRIFTVSMGDLFGEWVPGEWIAEVFKACEAAPQHQYMFLTKNPSKYAGLFDGLPGEVIKNWWFGQSLPTLKHHSYVWAVPNHFLSIEPLLEEPEKCDLFGTGWIIVGAQTGPSAVKPKPEWVQGIIDQARTANVPIFLKDNLGWTEQIREFPEVAP